MKSKNKMPSIAYERARKRVDDIKGFCVHLTVYSIVGLLVLFTKTKCLSFIRRNNALQDVYF